RIVRAQSVYDRWAVVTSATRQAGSAAAETTVVASPVAIATERRSAMRRQVLGRGRGAMNDIVPAHRPGVAYLNVPVRTGPLWPPASRAASAWASAWAGGGA